MKFLVSILICFSVVLFSCTDRDDKLEGVQIRVQNTTSTSFTEIGIDSLVFSDIQSGRTVFYQQYNGDVLPSNVILTTDSLSTTVAVDNTFEIDSTILNLFTYKIKSMSEGENATIEILKD
ncbi:hypothetical protein FEE95_15685 [Maribacter algarum]|uniref:Uncharacterized protein n=1 Tax=Maribacter algarum (ex Zhang et al. 2020) TaxID=2578118 RepID=A0A5S3PNM3_9FLAO|nr:hypothetical protein [Maribacter algarum]TMM56074.1 hypothetical protein FEE95_15685 [Maribacter algarum]